MSAVVQGAEIDSLIDRWLATATATGESKEFHLRLLIEVARILHGHEFARAAEQRLAALTQRGLT